MNASPARRFAGKLSGLTALAALAATTTAGAASTRGADWATYNGPLRGTRYSPLKQITTSNVKRLHVVGRFDTGITNSFQTGPVVINGTMYLTTLTRTYAINAATGQLKWKYDGPEVKSGYGAQRGVAYADGRVFRGMSDGSVFALNANNGRKIWGTKIADIKKGESGET